MKIVLAIVAPIVLMFLCVLAVMLLPLPYPLSRNRDQIAAIGFGLCGFIYMAGLVIYLVWSMLGLGRSADPAFAQLGLSARPYALFGRQYHGTVGERQVAVYYIPIHRFHPGSLEIYLSASIRSRLTVSRARPLLGCDGCRPIAMSNPALSDFQILALDEAWARSLLADPIASAAVARLLAVENPADYKELYLQPGVMLLRVRPRDLSLESTRQHIEDMATEAQLAEQLDPSPGQALAATPEWQPKGDSITPIVLLVLIGSALPVLMLCLGAVIVALAKR